MELGSLVSALRAPIHDARSSSTQLVRPGHLSQTIRLRLDRVEHLLAERPNELSGVCRADATNHWEPTYLSTIEAGAEV